MNLVCISRVPAPSLTVMLNRTEHCALMKCRLTVLLNYDWRLCSESNIRHSELNFTATKTRKTERYILIHLCQCPVCADRQEEWRRILARPGKNDFEDVTRLKANSQKGSGRSPHHTSMPLLLIRRNELFGKANHRAKAIEILLTCFSNLLL